MSDNDLNNNPLVLSSADLFILIKNLDQAVLMENQFRKIVHLNQRFCDLFKIPVPPEQLIGADCSNAAEQAKHLFVHPVKFVDRINILLQEKQKMLGETLRMTDGKVLLRDFIPLWNKGQYIGHLWTYSDITRHVSTEELEIQQTINYFVSSLYNKETVEDILWDVCRNCIGKLGFTDCVIYLFDKTGTELEQKAAWGPKTTAENKIINPIRIPLGQGIVGSVAKSGVAEIIKDTSADPRYILDDQLRFSEITVPVISEGKILGIIDSEHPEKNFFSEKHLSILTTIASLCAIKIVQIEDTIAQRQEINRQKIFYEEILNNIPADIAVFDTDHRYLFVNPTGIKNDELRHWIIGKKDEDYCNLRKKPYSIFQDRRRYFNTALTLKKQIEWEETLKGAGNKDIFHLRKFYPVLDQYSNPKLVIGYGINITERRNIEDQVRLNEKKYRELFNKSPALIFTHDMDFRVTSINAAVRDILGFTEEQVSGKLLAELAPGGASDETLLLYIKTISTQNSAKGLVPVYRADGQLIYLLCHGYKVEQENQSPYVIVFGQDISDRIKMEEELYRAKLITEQNAEAKESFLAKVSHEIRTPMNGILGVADLLYKSDPNEQQRHYISVLKRSAQNLLAIVNDVLDIEKILAGKMLLENVAFNLEETVDLLRDIFSSQAAENNNRLDVINSIDGKTVFNGDPFRISQVLGNLLSNAVKFTRSGLITLTISVAEEDKEYTWVSFEVKDTGIGIPKHKLEEVFEPFAQVHFNSKANEMGTGLGLTICKEIAELMQGTLRVESIEKSGSVFTFIIPLKRSNAAWSGTEKPAADFLQLNGKRILLAEDMELNQFIVKEMVKDWGLSLTIVSNGKEAVELVTHTNFDLVLMDIQMPVMNGVQATRCIRELKNNPNAYVPIVALSANAFESDKNNYLQAGMNATLSKPFDADQLFKIIAGNLVPYDKKEKIKSAFFNKNIADEINIDLTYLLKIGKQRKGFVTMMLESFRDTASEICIDMEASLDKKEWQQIGQLVHKLKFSLGVIGVHALEEEVAWIEQYTSGPDEQLQSQLQIRVLAFITIIRELCEKANYLLRNRDLTP